MRDTKKVLKEIKKIELRTRKLVDGLLQGAYYSTFKGSGIEFSEVREYLPGDDVRIIDWNVTSRMNTPYVKEFIEERDLMVYILFDISKSSAFGTTTEKKEKAIHIAASLMFAGIKNNDDVGLMLFTKEVEHFMKAKKGKRHVFKMIDQLLHFEPDHATTDINSALRFLQKVVKRKCVVFIISDFHSEDFSRQLKIISKQHDTVVISLSDVREHEIPDVGYIHLEDEETGEQILVDTSDEEFRMRYSKIAKAHHENLHRVCKSAQVDSVSLLSDDSFDVPLRNFFSLRLRRVR